MTVAVKPHRNGKKPVEKPVRRVRNRNGGAIIPGNPGNSGGKKGRSGRKPEMYKDLCSELIGSGAAIKSVERILKNDKHPHFASIYKHLAEHAYGKPVQPVSGEGGGPVTVRIVRENPAVATA